jgi:predicted O-methyltransferase YrrM
VSSERDTWAAVERFFDTALLPADPVLDGILQASAAAGLPAINVTPAQGRLLGQLVRLRGATRILEIGTLGGYSTIWLARGMPSGGRLLSLELNPAYAALARTHVVRAGVGEIVDIRVGPAADSLASLAAESAGPFDLVFIDADKVSTPSYFAWALRLTCPGAVIIVDNVVRNGAVADTDSTDPSVLGMRRFAEMLSQEKRVEATAIQTVGSKGYDGFVVALVTA